MIIYKFEDLPTNQCLLCGQKLKLFSYSFGYGGTAFICGVEAHYRPVWESLMDAHPFKVQIDLPDLQMDMRPEEIWFDRCLLPWMELDFSDVKKLKERLKKMVAFV